MQFHANSLPYLKFILGCVCFIAFGTQLKFIIKDFVNGVSNSNDWIDIKDELELPNLLFCPILPKVNMTPTADHPFDDPQKFEEQYLARTFDLEDIFSVNSTCSVNNTNCNTRPNLYNKTGKTFTSLKD